MKNHLFTVPLSLLLFFLSPLQAFAIDNEECMDCHGDSSIERESSTGISEQIHFEYREFQYSVHNINGIGCIDCHSDITELDMDNDVPHPAELAPVICSTCHEEEGGAYAESVHHQAGKKGMNIQCYACHGYHFVKSLANKPVLERENSSCLKCHDPFSQHNWLPQKETHFTYVECTVCHAPDAPRHIHLRFYDLVTNSFLQPQEIFDALNTDRESFMALLDHDANERLDKGEFENMVFILRRRGIHTTFHGELLSEHQPLIHQVKRGAAQRNCQDCHASSSPFFEAVTLFFTYDDATSEHYAVDRDVLETYSVSNFYIPGGTRIRELDLVGVLLIAGTVIGISGHLFGRILTAPIRRKKRAAALKKAKKNEEDA